MKKLGTIILALALFAGALYSCYAQTNTYARQVRFQTVQYASDTAQIAANSGRAWYDFITNRFRCNENGVNKFWGGTGSGGGGDMILAATQTSTGKKTFQADATNCGINVGVRPNSNPTNIQPGDIYYRTDLNAYGAYNGTSVYQFVYQQGQSGGANRIPYYLGANHLIGNEAGFEYNPSSNTLTSPNATFSTVLNPSFITANRVVYKNTGNTSVSSEAGFEYNETTNILTVPTVISTGSHVTGSGAGGGQVNINTDASITFGNSTTPQATSAISVTPAGSGGNGGNLQISAGSAFTGNANGGNLILTSGSQSGTGTQGYIILQNIPTSSAGLPSGAVWSNAGVLTIVP